MEGVSHNIVMSAEEADHFEVLRSLGWEVDIHMGFAVNKTLDTIAGLIGKTTEETLATNHGGSTRYQHRYPKAVTVAGWNGIGKERIVKYTTKRVMEAKLFDTLIWMMGQEEDLSLKTFQTLVAEGLKIPIGRHDNNDEDSDAVDIVVSDKISLVLQDRNFLLVHNGSWGQDLRSLGIPGIKRTHSMILVASKNPRERHMHCSLHEFHGDQWMDFLEGECELIVESPRLRKAHINITPKAVKNCIIYFAYITQNKSVDIDVQLQTMRHWFAEGFIGDATLDLETIFIQGCTIFEELQERGMIKFVSQLIDVGKIFPCGLLHIGYEASFLGFKTEPNSNPKTKVMTWLYQFLKMSSTNPTPVSMLTSIILFSLSPTSIHLQDILEITMCDLPEDFLKETRCVRVLTLVSEFLSKLPSSLLHLANSLTFLNLQNCINLVQVPYLSALVKLQMLDLSNTPLEELPQDCFENLQCLRLLDLTRCVKLSNLPSSISCLLNLEQLFLGGCRSLKVLPSYILPLEKLQMLDLSRTMTEIPEQFFGSMISLKDLNLSFNSQLTSLPKSISNLVNLKKLNLKSCSALRILSLTSRHLPLSLEELNLANSSCLQDISSVSSSSGNLIPNLRVFNISGIQLQCISFKMYSSLENIILQSNTNLEFLDLSGTNITKFPLEGKPHLNGLRRLDLLGVKHIRSVNWNNIDLLPHEVNWDECGDGSISHMRIPLSKWRKEGSGGVFLSLTSARILNTLSSSSRLWEKCLSRFLVYICPSADRGKGRWHVLRSYCLSTRTSAPDSTRAFLIMKGVWKSKVAICFVEVSLFLVTQTFCTYMIRHLCCFPIWVCKT